jgi:hypothetical protein
MERKLQKYYQQADTFLLCFSLIHEEDLHFIADVAFPLIARYTGSKRVVLCGTDCNQRDIFNVGNHILPHHITNFILRCIPGNCVEYIRLFDLKHIQKSCLENLFNICMFERRILTKHDEKRIVHSIRSYYHSKCKEELERLISLKQKREHLDQVYQQAIDFRTAVQYLEDSEHNLYHLKDVLPPIYELCHSLQLQRGQASTMIKGNVPYKLGVSI